MKVKWLHAQAIEQVQRDLEEASAQIFYIGRWIKRR